MTVYYIFCIYLAGMIASVLLALRCAWRRDWEALAVPVIALLCSFIGAANNWLPFLRVFGGLYGITFNG